MYTNTSIKKVKEIFLLAFLFIVNIGFSQSINAPTFAFTQICASPSFNSYSVNFNFTGTFNPGNQFVLEMSDASGSFIPTATTLATSTTISTSPGTINFSVPTTTAGQNFRVRVRSTNPAVIGSSSANFPAYYQSFNNSFYINNQVSSVNICTGGNYTLAIDNPTVSDPSPVSFPSLKYKWYRNSTVIPGEIGTSINVSTAGVYRVEIDYGSCSTTSSITKSQDVTVNIVSGGSTFTVTSNTGNTICPSITTVLSTEPGYNYQWFTGGVNADNPIPGATSYTYSPTVAGAYKVLVNQGGCSSTSNIITLSATGINPTIDVEEAPAINKFIEGDTKTITVNPNGTLSPTYQWFLEGTPIPGETNSSLSTTQEGNYKVIINQTTGCSLSKEILFILKYGIPVNLIPNTISPNNKDGFNDTWDIPNEYKTQEHEITIMDSYGKIVFQKTNYQGDWPTEVVDFKSVNPVYFYIISKADSPLTQGSITIIK